METTKMIGILLVCALSIGTAQCEAIEDSGDLEEENPYLVKGNLYTCGTFPFAACKEECLGDSGLNTCRELCCTPGTQEASYACYQRPMNEIKTCILGVEAASCNSECLATCRSCTDICAEYYEYCLGGVDDRTSLGCCWRD